MILRLIALGALLISVVAAQPQTAPPVRLAVAGLVHGHVDGFLRAIQGRKDVQLVGVYDPDAALRQSYARKFSLPESLFFADLNAMLDGDQARGRRVVHQHPRSPRDRRGGGQAPHPRHDGEAAGGEHRGRPAHRARRGEQRHPGHRQLRDDVVPEPRRDVDAAQGPNARPATSARWSPWTATRGPKEIGVSPEFFAWLTDPEQERRRARCSTSAATAPT